MHNKITIVIPSKNEQDYIGHLLDALSLQNIGATRVIVADCSSDRTREIILGDSRGLNIEIIDGGPVSVAKNRAAQLATTPYVLFIDADVRFFSSTVIRDAVVALEAEDLDLVGLNIRCYDGDRRAQLGFAIFNLVNRVLKHFSPFAVGAFMLTRCAKFREFGGFPEHLATSEDYFLSRKYSVSKFKILNHYFGQDSRRFRKMGYFGMSKYLLVNFLNRNNPQHWDRLDANKYWN
jgi:glycosyltransferase involved in cell wall biosynthesis